MDMNEIEGLAKHYAKTRDELAATVKALESEVAVVKRSYLGSIRSEAASAANAKAALEAAVTERPDLFKRPKTRILHGIKVGFAKGKGKVSFASAARVVALIRKHLPASFEELVKVTETPLKGPLGRLSGAELKKIGVTVEETGDQVVIAPADSEIDKLVDALLDGAADKEGKR